MFGDLSDCTDNQLLEFVLLILSKPDDALSVRDHTELDKINQEFIRRGHSDLLVVR